MFLNSLSLFPVHLCVVGCEKKCEISRVLILCCLSFLIYGDLYCKFREFHVLLQTYNTSDEAYIYT